MTTMVIVRTSYGFMCISKALYDHTMKYSGKNNGQAFEFIYQSEHIRGDCNDEPKPQYEDWYEDDDFWEDCW